MASKVFIDTNVLLYAVSQADHRKKEIARRRIQELIRRGAGVVSAQVLNEFSYNAIKKLAATPKEVRTLLSGFESLHLAPMHFSSIKAALAIMEMASLSFWDANIIASAADAGCKILLSEDMNHGQQIGSIHIINPFAPV